MHAESYFPLTILNNSIISPRYRLYLRVGKFKAISVLVGGFGEFFAPACAAQCLISRCYTHTLSDFVLAAAANVRAVLLSLCIKGRVTSSIYSRFLHVGISPHPAFYRCRAVTAFSATLPSYRITPHCNPRHLMNPYHLKTFSSGGRTSHSI